MIIVNANIGSQMVLAMKIVSLAFDLDSGTVSELPNFSEYVGYSLHVGTVIFGPWTSYQSYAVVPGLRDRKMVSRHTFMICT